MKLTLGIGAARRERFATKRAAGESGASRRLPARLAVHSGFLALRRRLVRFGPDCAVRAGRAQ
ncbi:MAG: hypothetical protein ACK5RK_02105 [Betaproteobacteria bacterium]